MPVTIAEVVSARPPTGHLDEELAGLDALDLPRRAHVELAARIWSATWPKLAAVAIALLVWQLVVWSGWKPDDVLPPPATVLRALWTGLTEGTLVEATANTLRRAAVGFALALVIGVVIGALVSQVRVLRVAVGSLLTGLQTMPSITWFPLALLLLGASETAIMFVVVLGAAPAIANGLVSGADQVSPGLVRAGRVLGARGFSLYRHVVAPASLPSFVGGLKQGWAFAWRSLLAGELIVVVANRPSIGVELATAREHTDTPQLLAAMMLILVIGIVVDSLVFGTVERAVRRRWGLVERTPS